MCKSGASRFSRSSYSRARSRAPPPFTTWRIRGARPAVAVSLPLMLTRCASNFFCSAAIET